jgi:4-hydroxy-L-threonine phosphate dehydrogenase PdxA
MELSAGEVLEAYHTPEQEIFLMDTKNQFWWTMFHAQEMKIALISAHINLSATVVTTKTSLLLAHLHIITLLVETTD